MRKFVCPARGAANRAPDGKDPLAAKCGRSSVQRPSRRSRSHGAQRVDQGAEVLVDVGAPWCEPCRALAPDFAPQFRLPKLNSEAEPKAASTLGVCGIPALRHFRDARVIARSAGPMSSQQIVAWTRQAFAPAQASASRGSGT